MPKENYLLLLLLIVVSSAGFAQQPIAGRVIKKGSREIVQGVNVTNISLNKRNVSDGGGDYIIPAREGDTILFSSAGYLTDTIVAAPYMFSEDFLVPLVPHVETLAVVEVDEASRYRLDSMRRMDEYEGLFNKKHPVKLMNEKRPADAPGLSFSPIGYFSKDERKNREFKANLLRQEEEYYIDYKFSPARIMQLTNLRGDSLHMFMLRNRPTYKFCRIATSRDMLLYINDRFILFKQGK